MNTTRSTRALEMSMQSALEDHLRKSGLCGVVATPAKSVLENILKLLAGHPEYTFGLSGWETSSLAEVVKALNVFTGEDVTGLRLAGGDAVIDPATTVADLGVQRQMLWDVTAQPAAKVLIATGHPTGLLEHYIELARWCRSRGSRLITALEDTGNGMEDPAGGIGLRYVSDVACPFDGRSLVHTHSARLMELVLSHLEQIGDTPDLVIADHGMAGAAIERGIATISIADVNDPALPLAKLRGRSDGVAMMDDNLPPSVYRPITGYLTN
jgi:hypothetical protein